MFDCWYNALVRAHSRALRSPSTAILLAWSGVSSGSGGLGWFIYENKNQLEIPNVFAGRFTVIVIGLLVENVIFRTIESRTVRKWGMQN